MNIDFEKWHGCKNDFIVIWSTHNEAKYLVDSLQRQASVLCGRKGEGVGADGILVLLSKTKAELLPEQVKIINADGSLASNCGNGLRCAASSIYKKNLQFGHLTELPQFVELIVEDRPFICHFLEGKTKQQFPYISIEMGKIILNEKNSWHKEVVSTVTTFCKESEILIANDQISSAQIGNKHIVLFTDTLSRKEFEKIANSLQSANNFEGINVHLAIESELSTTAKNQAYQIVGESIEDSFQMTPWERGCGFTEACGSGACAVGALALDTGFLSSSSWVAVQMPGGNVFVRHQDYDLGVQLAGAAHFVFQGTLSF